MIRNATFSTLCEVLLPLRSICAMRGEYTRPSHGMRMSNARMPQKATSLRGANHTNCPSALQSLHRAADPVPDGRQTGSGSHPSFQILPLMGTQTSRQAWRIRYPWNMSHELHCPCELNICIVHKDFLKGVEKKSDPI